MNESSIYHYYKFSGSWLGFSNEIAGLGWWKLDATKLNADKIFTFRLTFKKNNLPKWWKEH